jgi:hypothetical protein
MAFGVSHLQKYIKLQSLLIISLAFIILTHLNLIRAILLEPQNAQLPLIERWQYITGWPSGYGLPNLHQYLQKTYLKDKSHKLLIITEQETMVTMSIPLFHPEANYQVQSIIPGGADLNEYELLPRQNAIVILYHHQEIPEEWPLKLVGEITHGDGSNNFKVYEFTN